MYINEIRFESTLYGEESIIKESRMDWMRLSASNQLEFPQRLSMSKLSLQDLLIDLDEITELKSTSIFEFRP